MIVIVCLILLETNSMSNDSNSVVILLETNRMSNDSNSVVILLDTNRTYHILTQ